MAAAAEALWWARGTPPHCAPPGPPAADVIAAWDMERSNPIIRSTTWTNRGGILKWSREGDSVHVPMVRATFAVRRREFSSPAISENSSVVGGGSGAPQSK